MKVWVRFAFLMVVLGLAAAWTYGPNRKSAYRKAEAFQYPWAPSRRNAYVPCAFTGQRCLTTSQCCNEYDICLTSFKYSNIPGEKGRISTCHDMRKEMKYAKYNNQLKASGEICTDSSECAGFCCREVRGHRSRYYVCGTPEDDFKTHTCIKATRTGNDVFDDLI